jgi:V8-like Glu-specific endopeptidase
MRIRPEAPQAPDTDAVLRLVGRFTSAHACPISEQLALTNAHVTDMRPFDQSVAALPLIWSALGHEGPLRPLAVYSMRDLALMESAVPFTRWYTIASAPPAPGDRLWTVGYEWRKRSEMFAPRAFTLTLLRVLSRNLIFTPETARGASGSCVLNARGEVVAINAWSLEAEDAGNVGVAVGVWGETFGVRE